MYKHDEGDVLSLPRRVFKEDSFDPVSRVRRGTVYHADGHQPARWFVQDPYRQDLGNAEFKGQGSKFQYDLVTYQRDPLNYLTISPAVTVRVVLGEEPFSSAWKVVSIESTALRILVMTLKADSLFGELPEIVPEAVPDTIRAMLVHALEEVASSVHRLSAVAVVDRCRDALSLIFGELVQEPKLDLVKAAEKWASKDGRDLCVWSAKIVARLHSPAKPNEARTRDSLAVVDQDAVLAVHCLGTVLREIRWARR